MLSNVKLVVYFKYSKILETPKSLREGTTVGHSELRIPNSELRTPRSNHSTILILKSNQQERVIGALLEI